MQEEFKKQAKKENQLKSKVRTAKNVAQKIKNITDGEATRGEMVVINKQLQLLPASEILVNEFNKLGMTPEYVAKKIFEMTEAIAIKVDKNGEIHEFKDNKMILEAIKTWDAITGTSQKSGKQTHNHLHLENVSDDELDSLLGKTSKNRKDKAQS